MSKVIKTFGSNDYGMRNFEETVNRCIASYQNSGYKLVDQQLKTELHKSGYVEKFIMLVFEKENENDK